MFYIALAVFGALINLSVVFGWMPEANMYHGQLSTVWLILFVLLVDRYKTNKNHNDTRKR